MHRSVHAALVAALGIVYAGVVLAQSTTTTGTPKTIAPALAPGDGTCLDDPPVAVGCVNYRCSNGIWVPVTKTSGACTDGDPCHYGMTCNASGVCGGGGTVVCTGCQVCNGTSTCALRAAGTSCSTVPGLSTACSCSAAGTCQTASGSAAQTAFCWDERGNMTGKFIIPPANACPLSCP